MILINSRIHTKYFKRIYLSYSPKFSSLDSVLKTIYRSSKSSERLRLSFFINSFMLVMSSFANSLSIKVFSVGACCSALLSACSITIFLILFLYINIFWFFKIFKY